MKKLLTGLLAMTMLVGAGWSRTETANQDKHRNKAMIGTYDDGGTDVIRNVAVNNTGEQVVDAGTNTFTVAGPQLEAIEIATEATEGAANTITVNTGLTAAGITIISVDTTSIDGDTTLIAEGITIISVDTTSIDGDTTLIADGITIISVDTTSIDGKMVDGTDIGDVTINNAAAGAAVNIQDGGNTITVDGIELAAIEGAGNTMVVNTGLTAAGITIISQDTTSIDNKIDNGGGVEAGAVLVTMASDSTGLLSVDDNGGSLTVDGSVTMGAAVTIGSPVGGGTEATAVRVTIANDSTGLVSVDDNGSTLSVDDAAGKLTVDWNGVDPPIGGGTESTALKVTLASDSTGLVSVDDNGGSLTVDGSVGLTAGVTIANPLGGGVEAGAVLVTLASDSTGLVSIDDNGGSLTVDSTALNAIEGAGNTTVVNTGLIAAGITIISQDTTSIDDKIDNGGGVEAGAVLVTMASDSTGLVSVDDNAGKLTVDWNGTDPPIGSQTTAASLAVAIASDQAAVTVASQGNVADGTAAGVPHLIAGKDSGGTVDTYITDSQGRMVVAKRAGSGDNFADANVGQFRDSGNQAVVPYVIGMLHDGLNWDRPPGDSTAGAWVNVKDIVGVTIASPVGGGTEAAAVRVTVANDSTGVLSVDDNAGALTVDWAGTAPPIGGGTEAAALKVTIANDSTGLVSVDDNGSSLTIDNADITTIAGAVTGTEMQVDIVTDQPLTATTDKVGSTDRTDKMLDNVTEVTPKFAKIDAAGAGDNTLVAAVASKKIRVLSVVLVAAGAVNVRFESGAAGTALTGQMNLTTNSGFSATYCPVGHFETAANTLLNLELSGAVSVDGWLTYIEVD